MMEQIILLLCTEILGNCWILKLCFSYLKRHKCHTVENSGDSLLLYFSCQYLYLRFCRLKQACQIFFFLIGSDSTATSESTGKHSSSTGTSPVSSYKQHAESDITSISVHVYRIDSIKHSHWIPMEVAYKYPLKNKQYWFEVFWMSTSICINAGIGTALVMNVM